MRHLIVPSVATQHWLDEIKSRDWLELGIGVLTMENGMKAIPLNNMAPVSTDQIWQSLAHIEIVRDQESVKHWTDLLDRDLYQSLKDYWPRAYEVVGDIIILKLEPEVYPHRDEIGKALLERIPNVRLVCADNGVQGKFRVRNLLPIISRDGSTETLTRIRENGHNILVDPTKSYFSSRLSTERLGNLNSAKTLAHQLNRSLTICDPYAGVGPSFANLISEENLVAKVLAGDLNPQAVGLLERNIEHYIKKSPGDISCVVLCQDARLWQNSPNYQKSVDLLLVNLPHSTVEHLAELFPLMRRETVTLIRGWAIIGRDEMSTIETKLSNLFSLNGATDLQLTCHEIKGFSASKVFIRIESWQTFV